MRIQNIENNKLLFRKKLSLEKFDFFIFRIIIISFTFSATWMIWVSRDASAFVQKWIYRVCQIYGNIILF